jgi:hypothetical protein
LFRASRSPRPSAAADVLVKLPRRLDALVAYSIGSPHFTWTMRLKQAVARTTSLKPAEAPRRTNDFDGDHRVGPARGCGQAASRLDVDATVAGVSCGAKSASASVVLVYRGTALGDLDLPALLARSPQPCPIDELAHNLVASDPAALRALVAALGDVGVNAHVDALRSAAILDRGESRAP